MSDYLKEVLLRRTNPENQQFRVAQATNGGIQDVNGHQIRNPFLESIITHLQFDGDPRIGTKEEIEAAGFKIKEAEVGVEGVKKDKEKSDFRIIKQEFDQSKKLDSDKKIYEAAKKEYLTTYYNGNQIESDQNEFLPYINEFKFSLSEEQKTQLAQLEKMAESIGVEIRHFGNRELTSPDYDQIVLPTKEHFVSANAYMQVLAHELIHATKGKAPQFNDQTIPEPINWGDTHYVVDEWRAELGSVVLMDKLGINYDLDLNAYYVNSWSAELKDHIPVRYLTVEERWVKIEQAIDSANFLLEKSGLEPMKYTEEAIGKLKKINEAYPNLPVSSYYKDKILNDPTIGIEVKNVYTKLYDEMATSITEKAGDRWVTPMLTEITNASIEKGITADKIIHMGINEQENILYTVAKNYYPFATVDVTTVSKEKPEERLQEATQVYEQLTQQMEQKELDRQLQLAQQQERGGRGFA